MENILEGPLTRSQSSPNLTFTLRQLKLEKMILFLNTNWDR